MFRQGCHAGTLLLAILLAGGCERSRKDRAVDRRDAGPNVLLITLDTTRADRLGCYGYAGAQTPALDGLAGTGVRFAEAFCQVPLTLPSHTSLLTGTYPPTNGIRVNAGGILSEDVPTLAEAFKGHGYRTGAFVSAWVLNATFGLQRGFDRYDDRVGGDETPASIYQERPADATCEAALAWLSEPSQTPFFAWVHFFDPHFPYAPPAEFRRRAADPYDGEIAFVDSQVRRLVEWLEMHGARERTLVVIAGDHGEAFAEHGEHEHGLFLYDPTLHVPLIFSFPSRLPAGKVVSADVRLIDVVPTIGDLLGWEPVPALPGESLRPACEADAFPSLPVYAESEYPRFGFGWAALQAFTTESWKFIAAPRAELYDRRADPGELTNVFAEHADVGAQLREELQALMSNIPLHEAKSVTLDDKTLQALESLGYVGVGAPSADGGSEPPRRDPKDMIAVHQGLLQAQRLLQERHYAEVVSLLEPLALQSPESDELRAALGEAYLNLGRYSEAEREYRAALRTVPTNPRKLCRLGDALRDQHKNAEALECYQRAASASPNYGTAHNRLGALYMEKREFAQAHEHFRRDLELNPTSPNAMANLAAVLTPMGRTEEAVQLLRQALQVDPHFAPAHRALWQVLASNQRRVEAVEALRAATQALPEKELLKRQLAGLLAATPQLGPAGAQEALSLAKECCAADSANPENYDVLGIAYAAAGDFAQAIQAARQALTLAERQGKSELAGQINLRLQAYQSSRLP